AMVAAGYVAYVTGSVYRAVAVIRLSDPRRAFTGGVVDDPALLADGRYADPLLSQVELLKSRTVAGGVVDSMPMLRVVLRKSSPSLLDRVLRRRFSPNLLGVVAVRPDAAADSLSLTFERDGFLVGTGPARRRAAYGTVVEVGGVRFAILRRPEVRQGVLRVLSRDAAISGLLTELRVRPRMRTDIVDVAYSAPDPARAQEVVNRVVDAFRAASAEAAQGQSRLRREFLEAQLKVNDSLVADAQAAVQGAIASLDGRIAAINDLRARRAGNLQHVAQEARLTERVENARKVADELRTEYQKAGIAEAVTVGQVEIVDHATLPMKPAGIGLAEQLALGLLVGLILGAGGAFVAERVGSSIARRVEVEHLGLSVLGIV